MLISRLESQPKAEPTESRWPTQLEEGVAHLNRSSPTNVDSVAEPQVVSAPLVFQCSTCRTIVGDSFSWVCATKELNAVSLYGKSNKVQLGENLLTSNTGFDIGSTYMSLICSCKTTLGKVYKTTPRLLDNVRDMYTFALDFVTCYELGRNIKDDDYPLPEEQVAISIPDARTFQLSIAKIQNLICILNERMVKLEQTQFGQMDVIRSDHPSASNLNHILSQIADEPVALLPQTQERRSSPMSQYPKDITSLRASTGHYSTTNANNSHKIPETPNNLASTSPELNSSQKRKQESIQKAQKKHHKTNRKQKLRR